MLDKSYNLVKKILQIGKMQNMYLIIRYQDYKSRSLTIKNEIFDSSVISTITGVGIQAFSKSGHMGFSSIDTCTNEKMLTSTAQKAINNAKIAQKEKFEPIKEVFGLKKEKGKEFQKTTINPFNMPNKDLEDKLSKFHKYLVEKYEGLSIANTILYIEDKWRILRSDGSDVSFSVSIGDLYSQVSITEKDNANTIFEKTSSTDLSVLHDRKVLSFHKQLLDNGLTHLKRLSKADNIKPGNYTLLLDGVIAGIFMHEAFGHTAESDNIYQDSPLLKSSKINKGQRVAKSYVNIVDHARKEERGFYPYSSYGVKRKKATIVKGGKINSLLTDVPTASSSGSILTGASRAEFYSDIPVPRMSNTYIELDKKHTVPLNFNHLITDVDKIHKELKRKKLFEKYPEVIYLIGSSGGQVDPIKGNFQFNSKLTFRLTNRDCELLKPVSFSGLTIETLKSIVKAFGDSIDWPGFCGKSGQAAIVNSKGPMLLLEKNKFVTIG